MNKELVVIIAKTGELLLKGRFGTLLEAEKEMKNYGYNFGFAEIVHYAESGRRWNSYKREIEQKRGN